MALFTSPPIDTLLKELMKRHPTPSFGKKRTPPLTTRYGYRGGKFMGDLLEKQAHSKGQGDNV